MRRYALVLAMVAMPSALYAQNMPLNDFLKRATALEKKGPLALLSSDIGVLKRELEKSEAQLLIEQAAASKAGRKDATCFPDSSNISSNELLRDFRSIPVARRNISVKAAFKGFLQKKYPCPS